MDNRIIKAKFFKKRDNRVVCLTCERRCEIAPEMFGLCKTRKNINGQLYTLVYGDISSISANPIEKKPFFHFYPGTRALTVGSWSCNFTCPWCQNYEISKHPENVGKGEYVSPKKFMELLERYKCQGTSISFNEPSLLLEYSMDVFKLAKGKGYYNTFVTNGYMTQETLKALIDSGLDAMNIDIKGDREDVKKYCGADIEKIWRNAILAKKQGIWIELTTLLIPGINEKESQIRSIAERIKEELGDEIPWHVTGYYPAYEFAGKTYVPPTSIEQLELAINIGKNTGLKYVYIGNIPGHKYENTYCPECGELLIERSGFLIGRNKLAGPSNLCPNCKYEIAIIN